MSKQQDLDQTLDDLVNELPKSLQPSRDLWAGIERGIDDQIDKRHKFKWMSGIAASLFLVVGISTTLMFQGQNNSEWVAYLEQLQMSHENQIQAFELSPYQSASMERQHTPAQEALMNELKGVRAAQKQVLQALKNEPENFEMLQLLQWTQQQELHLMQQAQQHKMQYSGRSL